MSKLVKNRKVGSIFKSRVFLSLFFLPTCLLLVMTLISLIPYDGIEPMELEELLAVDIIILSIWFVIALCISLIVNNEKKKQIKVNDIEEKQCESKCETRTNFEKIEIKKENNQKCLYTCESGIDAHEYKRLTKYFSQIYWVYITRCTIVNIIIFLVVSVAVNSVFVSVIYLLISQAILMIYYKVRLEYIAFNDFNKSYEKEHFDTVFHIEFFNDYFIRHGDTISQKVDYSSINKCVEADTRFYLKNKISNKIFIIKKDECDTNLINFIREKFESTEYYIKDINGHKNYKKNCYVLDLR